MIPVTYNLNQVADKEPTFFVVSISNLIICCSWSHRNHLVFLDLYIVTWRVLTSSILASYCNSSLKVVETSFQDQAVNGQAVDKRLKGRRNGFFVECGAGDGFTLSQTLFLELERNWTGLLVEPNDAYFKEILRMNRKVKSNRLFVTIWKDIESRTRNSAELGDW